MTFGLVLTSNHTGASASLHTGAYSIQREGTSLGNAAENPSYARTIASYGVRVSGASLSTRDMSVRVLTSGATRAAYTTAANTLERVVRDVARYGGRIVYTPTTGYATTYTVGHAALGPPESGSDIENAYRAFRSLTLLCDPIGSMPTLGQEVLWASSTDISSFAFDAGAAGQVQVVTAGQLIPNGSLTTEKRARYTLDGHLFNDVELEGSWSPGSTITSTKHGLALHDDGAGNRIEVYVDDNGTNSRLRIDTVVAGVATNRYTTNLAARVANGTRFWLTARLEAGYVYAEYWLSAPSPRGTATNSATPVGLSALSLQSTFGVGSSAQRVGWIWTPQHASAVMWHWKRRPYTYRAASCPDVFTLYGSVPGTHDALISVSYTNVQAAYPIWMLYATWPEEPAYNLVWNHGFETNTSGWAITAVAGVSAACNSLTRVTTAGLMYEGIASGQVVTDGTDEGPNFPIHHRFKKGVTHTIKIRARANGGATTQIRCKLGVSGDIATSTNTALSASWVEHTTTWTPTADVFLAYAAITAAAATSTTFEIDRIMVYEGTTEPSYAPGGNVLGLLHAGGADTIGASVTQTADAACFTGHRARSTTTPDDSTHYAEWFIHPWTMTPDDYYGDEIEVAVFARLQVGSALGTLTATLSLAPADVAGATATEYYSYAESGPTGKALTLPSADAYRLYYLGSISVPVRRSEPRRMKLRVAFNGNGADTLDIDYLALCPAHYMAASQSGVADDSGFAHFLNSASQTTRRHDSDLTGWVIDPTSSVGMGRQLASSLLLSPLKLRSVDSRRNRFMVLPSDQICDRADSDSESQTSAYTGTITIDATPQVELATDEA